MSHVNSADTRIITSKDDVMATYDGVGAENSKTGIEVELSFINAQSLEPLTVPDNEALLKAGHEALPGDWIRQEPTAEMLEINSKATDFDGIAAILEDANTKIKTLSDVAQGLGFKRSLFQDLPHVPARDLLSNVVNVERYQAFFKPPRADMFGIADYFSVSKSNQVSVSYIDHDHMLENVRRLYTLAPFLFMLTDNSAGFAEGRAINYHHGIHYRRFLDDRGGVPCYVYTAQSGAEYIDAHIRHVMHNPLYVYYDENSILTRIPSGQWESFEKLREKGLNTAANYNLAESVLWPDVKIAALKDKDDIVIGHRFEARMFGVGAWQHQAALLMTAGLAFDPVLAERIDRLLLHYGFDPSEPERIRQCVLNAYEAAYYHENRFFEVCYGNGNMADFALEFADIFEAAESMQPYHSALKPMLSVCRTGLVDAKVNQMLFPTLDDVKNILQTYDQSVFDNPNQCAHMMFADQLKQAA